MEIETNQPQSASIRSGNIFKIAIQLYMENWALFGGLIVFGYSLLVAEPLLRIYYENNNLHYIPIAGLIGGLLSLWANIALIRALSHRYRLQKTSGTECLKEVRGVFWSYVLYSGLFCIVV